MPPNMLESGRNARIPIGRGFRLFYGCNNVSLPRIQEATNPLTIGIVLHITHFG